MSAIITYLDIDGLILNDMTNYYLFVSNLYNNDRNVIMNELYTDGQAYDHAKTKEKPMLLQGLILGDVIANLYALKQCLFKPGLKKLTVGVNGANLQYIMVDFTNWVSDPDDAGIISCQAVAPKPYFYSQNANVLSLGAISNTSLTFPLVFPIIFGAVTGGSGVITNLGNAVAYPVITIVGTCDTINITNTTTGQSMGCNQAISNGSTLIIDCRPSTRGITYNGANAMSLKNVNDSWITCAPGDNVFVFTRNSLETKQHCSISLQSRWI